MHTMELTDREKKAVLGMRDKATRNEIEKQARLEILRAAYEFEKWLQTNSASSTFSTFCDDFGYINYAMQRDAVFEAVSPIRDVARNKAPDCVIKAKAG